MTEKCLAWSELAAEVSSKGLVAGGLVDAGDAETWSVFHNWLARGCAGDMTWLARFEEERRHPRSVFPAVRSLLIVLLPVRELLALPPIPLPEPGPDEPWGTFLPYAVAPDYHLVLRQRMRQLGSRLKSEFPTLTCRSVVDTAPLLEKEWAQRAGLGELGRHCLLIHPEYGSRFFIGTLLLSLSKKELVRDTDSDHSMKVPIFSGCGTCRKCIESCPTGALRGDGTMDARLCLNYWSIEAKEKTVPDRVAAVWGKMLFGCDRCQRACPRNRNEANRDDVRCPLSYLTALSESKFQELFAGTPLLRLGRTGLARNIRQITSGQPGS